jgi:hypothetical protein
LGATATHWRAQKWFEGQMGRRSSTTALITEELAVCAPSKIMHRDF